MVPEEFTSGKYWVHFFRLQRSKATRTMLKWLDVKTGESILDIGCREARLMQFFKDTGVKYIGIDSGETTVMVANLRFPNSARLASAESLPFPDKSFDKIVMCHVIEHIQDYGRAISEARRVLKDEGLLILSYPSKYYLPYLLGLVKQDAPHKHTFSSFQEWRGFEQVKKNVFPPLFDSIPLSQVPILRELFYNVVLLMRKKPFGAYKCRKPSHS